MSSLHSWIFLVHLITCVEKIFYTFYCPHSLLFPFQLYIRRWTINLYHDIMSFSFFLFPAASKIVCFLTATENRITICVELFDLHKIIYFRLHISFLRCSSCAGGHHCVKLVLGGGFNPALLCIYCHEIHLLFYPPVTWYHEWWTLCEWFLGEGKEVFCQAMDTLKRQSAQYKGVYVSGLHTVLWSWNS